MIVRFLTQKTLPLPFPLSLSSSVMAAQFSPIFPLMAAAKKSPTTAAAALRGGVRSVISGASDDFLPFNLSSAVVPTASYHALTGGWKQEISPPLIFFPVEEEEDPEEVIEEEMEEEEDDDLDSHAPTDWKVTPRAHVFEVEVPGLEKEEIKVELEEDNLFLTISGKKKKKTAGDEVAAEVEEGENNINWVCCERSSGNFTRRFELPENVKADEVAASLKNGVLTVIVPKGEPKEVHIKTVEISG